MAFTENNGYCRFTDQAKQKYIKGANHTNTTCMYTP